MKVWIFKLLQGREINLFIVFVKNIEEDKDSGVDVVYELGFGVSEIGLGDSDVAEIG